MRDIETLLEEAAAAHGHLCAGQVLGVRMALTGCRALGIDEPNGSKRLLVYVEIDRYAADAIPIVTGCRLGKRTLKYLGNLSDQRRISQGLSSVACRDRCGEGI